MISRRIHRSVLPGRQIKKVGISVNAIPTLLEKERVEIQLQGTFLGLEARQTRRGGSLSISLGSVVEVSVSRFFFGEIFRSEMPFFATWRGRN